MAAANASVRLDREYETIYVLRQTVTKESSEGICGRLTEAVTREGGTLTRVENWGRRRLAYPVAKSRRGVYVYLRYVGQGAAVAEVERTLRMLDDVIKYQTVKLRDDVARASLVVAEEDLKFEHLEAADEAEEESLARSLGLEDISVHMPPGYGHSHGHGGGPSRDEPAAEAEEPAAGTETQS